MCVAARVQHMLAQLLHKIGLQSVGYVFEMKRLCAAAAARDHADAVRTHAEHLLEDARAAPGGAPDAVVPHVEELWRRAAAHGSTPACRRGEYFVRLGRPAEGVPMLLRGAEMGDVECQLALARRLAAGGAGSGELDKAEAYLRLAAAGESDAACAELACLLLRHRRTAEREAEAVWHCTRAVLSRNNQHAKFHIGQLMLAGGGTIKADRAAGRRIVIQAAVGGDAEARRYCDDAGW